MGPDPCRTLLGLLGELAPGPPRAVLLSPNPREVFRALEAFPPPLSSAPLGRGTFFFKPVLWAGKALPRAEAYVADEREGFPCVSGRVFSVENLGLVPDGVLFRLGELWGLAARKRLLKSRASATPELCLRALEELEWALEQGLERAEAFGEAIERSLGDLPGWGGLRLYRGKIVVADLREEPEEFVREVLGK